MKLVSISADHIQDRLCPKIVLEAPNGKQICYRALPGMHVITTLPEQIQLLNWSYSKEAHNWLPPVYNLQPFGGNEPRAKAYIVEVLNAAHAALDSDDGILALAAYKLQEVPPAPPNTKPRSAFTQILGVTSDHFKADEGTLTGTEYLTRRRATLLKRGIGVGTAAKITGFVPDLSNIPD